MFGDVGGLDLADFLVDFSFLHFSLHLPTCPTVRLEIKARSQQMVNIEISAAPELLPALPKEVQIVLARYPPHLFNLHDQLL